MAEVIDVALLSDEERTREPREISRPEREIQEDVEGEDNQRALGAKTPKLSEYLQPIPETSSQISVHTVLRTLKLSVL